MREKWRDSGFTNGLGERKDKQQLANYEQHTCLEVMRSSRNERFQNKEENTQVLRRRNHIFI
eukprot:4847791-Heterocapsa_arctica.AAC.1